MKTGRPGFYIPSAETLSCDVKNVFVCVHELIANMLQVHYHDPNRDKNILTRSQNVNGKLSFATDAWTSPNHKAYMAITVHFEKNGTPMALLLDLVEVPKSHTGVNLANAFVEVLEAFVIKDKVSDSNTRPGQFARTYFVVDSQCHDR
jgi:hypothetical protein